MDSLSIAASGLAAASARIGVSAHNVANAGTQGFTPASAEVQSSPQGSPQVSVELGQPEQAAQVDRALLAPSQTDLAQETVHQVAAMALYRAHLASLRTGQETDQALFDLVR